ncbi:MAG: rRNA maturation RNase YbeY [Hyphomicrobiales bacterium]|nr:rRNA maturation RNase YbeY [Hyphomicrobiales bacterium]
MTIEIDIATAAARYEALASTIAAALGVANRLTGPLQGELTVAVVDDARMRTLNRQWRDLDKPTNVLSFPAADSPAAPARYLGDIAISYETCRREAAAAGKALEDHVAHLAVHGFLHLLGHDHEADADAEAMEALERRILARIGVADPYIASDTAG